jgi:hypothetical protein
MLRKLVCALFAVAICFSVALADEIKGKVKSVDTDKNTITVTVDDKEQTFTITDDTKIVAGNQNKEVKDRLKSDRFKAGTDVVITTEKKDGKDVVTQIKLAGGKKK